MNDINAGPEDWQEIATTALDAISSLNFREIRDEPMIWEERLKNAIATLDDCASKIPTAVSNATTSAHAHAQTTEAQATPAAELFSDPAGVSLTALIDDLDDLGMAELIGRVVLIADRPSYRPLEVIPHREGLPSFNLVIAPRSGSLRGATGIFIGIKQLVLASVAAPIDNHPWRIDRRDSFDNQPELIELLSDYVGPPDIH